MSGIRAHAHALLSLLEADLSAALSALLRPMEQLFGEFPQQIAVGDQDPDGYDGIAPRPHYERLLPSEWLLADELPDEFLRRAAEREQASFALAFRAPRSRRRSVALLDTGPASWGLPRIAMLAALVALEQRAKRSRIEFAWRALGRDQPEYQSISTPAEARAFLASRQPLEATREGFEALRGSDELWLLGAPRWASEVREAAHLVLLREPWGGGAVEVTLEQRQKRARTLRLPMPAEPLCVRLLRHPFAAPKAAPGADQPTVRGELLFAGRGHRLITQSGASLSALSVPSHPGQTGGRAKTFSMPKDERLVAATYLDRLVVISASEQAVHLYGLPGSHAGPPHAGRASLSIRMRDTSALGNRELRPCVMLLGANQHSIALAPLTRGGTLLVGRRDGPSAYVMPERLLGCVHGGRSHQAVWVSEKGSLLEIVAQTPREADWRTLLRIDLPSPEQVFFHCPREPSNAYEGFVALRHGDRVSVGALRPPGTRMELQHLFVPADVKVIGLSRSASNEPQLVVLEDNGKTFSCMARSGSELSFHAQAQVEHAQMCPHSRTLAYATSTHWHLVALGSTQTLLTLPRAEQP